jgi:hypothetical protein
VPLERTELGELQEFPNSVGQSFPILFQFFEDGSAFARGTQAMLPLHEPLSGFTQPLPKRSQLTLIVGEQAPFPIRILRHLSFDGLLFFEFSIGRGERCERFGQLLFNSFLRCLVRRKLRFQGADPVSKRRDLPHSFDIFRSARFGFRTSGVEFSGEFAECPFVRSDQVAALSVKGFGSVERRGRLPQTPLHITDAAGHCGELMAIALDSFLQLVAPLP